MDAHNVLVVLVVDFMLQRYCHQGIIAGDTLGKLESLANAMGKKTVSKIMTKAMTNVKTMTNTMNI